MWEQRGILAELFRSFACCQSDLHLTYEIPRSTTSFDDASAATSSATTTTTTMPFVETTLVSTSWIYSFQSTFLNVGNEDPKIVSPEIYNLISLFVVLLLFVWFIRLARFFISLTRLYRAVRSNQVMQYENGDISQLIMGGIEAVQQIIRERVELPSAPISRVHDPIHLDKRSLRVVKQPGDKYAIEFEFDCDTECAVQLFYGVNAQTFNKLRSELNSALVKEAMKEARARKLREMQLELEQEEQQQDEQRLKDAALDDIDNMTIDMGYFGGAAAGKRDSSGGDRRGVWSSFLLRALSKFSRPNGPSNSSIHATKRQQPDTAHLMSSSSSARSDDDNNINNNEIELIDSRRSSAVESTQPSFETLIKEDFGSTTMASSIEDLSNNVFSNNLFAHKSSVKVFGPGRALKYRSEGADLLDASQRDSLLTQIVRKKQATRALRQESNNVDDTPATTAAPNSQQGEQRAEEEADDNDNDISAGLAAIENLNRNRRRRRRSIRRRSLAQMVRSLRNFSLLENEDEDEEENQSNNNNGASDDNNRNSNSNSNDNNDGAEGSSEDNEDEDDVPEEDETYPLVIVIRNLTAAQQQQQQQQSINTKTTSGPSSSSRFSLFGTGSSSNTITNNNSNNNNYNDYANKHGASARYDNYDYDEEGIAHFVVTYFMGGSASTSSNNNNNNNNDDESSSAAAAAAASTSNASSETTTSAAPTSSSGSNAAEPEVRIYKQFVQTPKASYEIQEIYGLEAKEEATRPPPPPSSSAADSTSPTVNKALLDLVDEGDTSSDDCVVCLSEPRDTISLPCRHMCVCQSCFQHINKCPICRTDITAYIVMTMNKNQQQQQQQQQQQHSNTNERGTSTTTAAAAAATAADHNNNNNRTIILASRADGNDSDLV